MMLPDGHRWVVLAKRDGVVIDRRWCAGKHLVPTAMVALAFEHLGGVKVVAHQIALRLVKAEPDAADVARGGGA